jgi:L-serine kinase (ADP)
VTLRARFELLPIGELRIHEEIEASDLDRLVVRIREDGRVDEPILVSEQDHVILNGHHRFAALKALGASRAPTWVVDYLDPEIVLDRWKPGPPLTKEEVLRRGREARPFPPKTTRHRLAEPLPRHPTPLPLLLDGSSVAARRL